MEKLHPGARWSFRITAYFSFLFFFIFIGFFIAGILAGILSSLRIFNNFVLMFLILILFILILVVIIGEIYARLAYNNWRYEFTQNELKMEKGIIWKNYRSIPYERIQNVEIHRGILARILGFSSLDIHTAGYSGYRGGRGRFAEGYIPAMSIQTAEKTREFLIKKIAGKKSGL